MEALSLLGAAKLTSPNPLTLVCSLKPDGSTNLATVSWWTFLSLEPEAIGFAMMKTSYTGEMIRASRELVLTVPGLPLKRQVMGCGSTSGRDTDKAKKFGIELETLPDCAVCIPAHSVVAIQCRLREFVDVGDHYFYICDVKNAYGNESEKPLFAWDGYGRIAPA